MDGGYAFLFKDPDNDLRVFDGQPAFDHFVGGKTEDKRKGFSHKPASA